jgi:hypothetical protein
MKGGGDYQIGGFSRKKMIQLKESPILDLGLGSLGFKNSVLRIVEFFEGLKKRKVHTLKDLKFVFSLN